MNFAQNCFVETREELFIILLLNETQVYPLLVSYLTIEVFPPSILTVFIYLTLFNINFRI